MSTGQDVTPATTAAELELAVGAIMDGKEVELKGAADPEVISRAILERILKADTFEAIFKPQGLPSFGDSLERPCMVHGFKFNPSRYQGGSSVYAVVDLTWDDEESGEVHSVCCGGRNVMMQLLQAMRHNLLPVHVQLISNLTGEGNNAYWLEAV